MSQRYTELLKRFKQDPDNEDIKSLIEMRHLFISAIAMRYNPESPQVIKMLTGVDVTLEDIKELARTLLNKFKEEDKRIHGIMYKSPNLSKFLGGLKDDS